jgi:outer membrane lipopolysaccharide assembly protein LptE/RlpB
MFTYAIITTSSLAACGWLLWARGRKTIRILRHQVIRLQTQDAMSELEELAQEGL